MRMAVANGATGGVCSLLPQSNGGYGCTEPVTGSVASYRGGKI